MPPCISSINCHFFSKFWKIKIKFFPKFTDFFSPLCIIFMIIILLQKPIVFFTMTTFTKQDQITKRVVDRIKVLMMNLQLIYRTTFLAYLIPFKDFSFQLFGKFPIIPRVFRRKSALPIFSKLTNLTRGSTACRTILSFIRNKVNEFLFTPQADISLCFSTFIEATIFAPKTRFIIDVSTLKRAVFSFCRRTSSKPLFANLASINHTSII